MTDPDNLKALKPIAKNVVILGVTIAALKDNEFVRAAVKSTERRERERLEIMALGMTVQQYKNEKARQAFAEWKNTAEDFKSLSNFDIEAKDG